jgi:HAD domain in Swiss Army Knife RNA repair proteins
MGELQLMKVIFLDIDGVLNTTATPKPNKESRVIDQALLARLKKLLQDTSAEVVLSSTWRHERDGLASAKQLGIPFMDVLPDMRPHPRSEEIVAWLEAHREVRRFAVIDDDDDCLDSLPLFQPSAAAGLTDKLAKAAADYLNGKTDKDMRRNAIVRTFQRAISYLKGHNG